MEAHEFVCLDCEADVYSWGGPPNATRCASCDLVRSMDLEPDRERELRSLLGCELPKKANDHGASA